MDYQTVFDISEVGYKSWSFPAFGLIFVAIGVVLVVTRKSFSGWWGRNPRSSSMFAFSMLIFAAIWTSVSFIATFSEYVSLNSANEEGRVCIIEGDVSNFKPMPFNGHAMERFCVKDVCFEYSDFAVTGGFNNTSSHGGPIKEGLPVRVTYVGRQIIKLEVAK